MKRIFYSLVVMLGIISITISSCKKESQVTDDQDLTSVEESAIAGENLSDLFTDMSSLSSENDGLFSTSGSDFQIKDVADAMSNSCGEVSISPLTNTWPKTMTIDFGDGCTEENMTRKGKIIAVFTDRFKNTGAKVTVTFENFQVNEHKIEGTKIIRNNGKNAAGNFNYTIEVSKSKISSSDKAISFSSVNNIEWVEGSATRTPADDIFSITGTASGTNSKGNEFSLSIVKPLIKKVSCRFIVAGSADIKTGTRPTRTIDYGSGDCDNKASVSVENVTREITLRK
jgi:hypothetical protein